MDRRVPTEANRPIVLYLHRPVRHPRRCPATASTARSPGRSRCSATGGRCSSCGTSWSAPGASTSSPAACPACPAGCCPSGSDQLERDGLVTHADGAYLPTPACEELRPLVFGLAEWGARWAFGEPRPDELDPTVLMWWIRGGIDAGALGDGRTVLHVRVPDARRTRFWFVVDPADVSLCFTDPGFDVDVTWRPRWACSTRCGSGPSSCARPSATAW